MSNYALVRILALRFVIPYACIEVNNHAMKIISYLWCIIRCYLCLMLGYKIFFAFCFKSWILARHTYLRQPKFSKKFSLTSLKLIWEKEILCSWSSLIFVWDFQKQHMKISSKVIDIQEGCNKNFHKDHWTK